MIEDPQEDLRTFLKATYPAIYEDEIVKEASWLEKDDVLDRDYAVILVDSEGVEHKKLAMNDAGNTVSSICYLLT